MLFRHELDHGITHLADYLEHLKKHCCTARKWQDTFFQQQNQEKKLLRMVQATTGDVVVVVERDMEESKVQCEECSKQVRKGCHYCFRPSVHSQIVCPGHNS